MSSRSGRAADERHFGKRLAAYPSRIAHCCIETTRALLASRLVSTWLSSEIGGGEVFRDLPRLFRSGRSLFSSLDMRQNSMEIVVTIGVFGSARFKRRRRKRQGVLMLNGF